MHVCYLNQTPEALQQEDPNTIASQVLPFANYRIVSRKPRYYYELILHDTDSYIFTHKFSRNLEAHQTVYPNRFETCIVYSKIIIYNVLSIKEYSNPNITRRISNIIPPHGILYKYNYWDYMEAFDRVLLYKNNFGQHSWFIRMDLPQLSKPPAWFTPITYP